MLSTLPQACPGRIDAHVHVFRPELPMVAGRRYTPGYDATLGQLFSHLALHGMDQAVLVQPSFLGTDNSYLLAAIAQAPDRLRGIAMVAPDATAPQLEALARQGVVGVRFNLVGVPLPALGARPWAPLLRRMAALGWHVELHRQAQDLPPLIDALLAAGLPVVVDHHGRPDPALGLADPSLNALWRFGASRQVWVKLSAGYRCAADAPRFEHEAARRFLQAFGADRLLWGSDWPHTQCESKARVAASLQALQASMDATALRSVLGDTARALYGFPAPGPGQRLDSL